MADNYYSKNHAGIEGIRSELDPDWDWSQRSKTLRRTGPSDEVRAKVKELTRLYGPPPIDLVLYGEFDKPDDAAPKRKSETRQEKRRRLELQAAADLQRERDRLEARAVRVILAAGGDVADLVDRPTP